MVNKNCVLSTLAAFVTMFVLGYVFYEPLLGDFFAANAGTATGVIKENPVFWQIIVGQLCGGRYWSARSRGREWRARPTGPRLGRSSGCC